MEVYSIGFTRRTAADFFGTLQRHGVKRLVDVRLNNSSQLAGFSKRDDLAFFLHEINGADYRHEPLLAPTGELLSAYREKKASWADYERGFLALLAGRQVEDKLDRRLFDVSTALLCSEATAERCHRRLVLEYLRSRWDGLTIEHL